MDAKQTPNDFIGKSWTDLDTPSLLLDIDQLDRNIRKMAALISRSNKQVRPHSKTHKCSKIAQLQLDAGGCVGISAATLGEAEGLVDAGIEDVLITSPVTSQIKIERLIACRKKSEGVIVVVDNPQNIQALDKAAAKANAVQDVLIDVDPGMGRTGALPGDVPSLASVISVCSNIRLRGVQCYAGNVQHVANFEERQRQSLSLMKPAAEVFIELQDPENKIDIFTGAGTGTHGIDTVIPALTDLQVGSYCLMDSEYGAILGSDGELRKQFAPSLSIHTTIVHINKNNTLTVDAGLKALYSTPHAPPIVLDTHEAGWEYEWLGDEHGCVRYPAGSFMPTLGAAIRLTAPHCDPTVNLYSRYFVVREGIVIDVWPIDLKDR